jgi:hypothetical protein
MLSRPQAGSAISQLPLLGYASEPGVVYCNDRSGQARPVVVSKVDTATLSGSSSDSRFCSAH